MKRLITLLVLSSVLAATSAEITIFTNKKHIYKLEPGITYYTDSDSSDIAISLQTPIVVWSDFSIGFGGTFPVSYFDRSRPHFSLNYYIVDRFQLGVSWVMSPHSAYGLSAGLSFGF